jgi:hypothetical protein
MTGTEGKALTNVFGASASNMEGASSTAALAGCLVIVEKKLLKKLVDVEGAGDATIFGEMGDTRGDDVIGVKDAEGVAGGRDGLTGVWRKCGLEESDDEESVTLADNAVDFFESVDGMIADEEADAVGTRTDITSSLSTAFSGSDDGLDPDPRSSSENVAGESIPRGF